MKRLFLLILLLGFVSACEVGDIQNNNFCDITNQFVAQKQNNLDCLNDFECLSLNCLDSKCVNLSKLFSEIANKTNQLNESLKIEISDSDLGERKHVKGITKGYNSSGSYVIKEDSCKDDSTLIEGFIEDCKLKTSEIKCSLGCNDGRCLGNEPAWPVAEGTGKYTCNSASITGNAIRTILGKVILEKDIQLNKGWNLLSIPFGELSLTDLRSKCPSILQVNGFNASKGAYYVPTKLEAFNGYWVYSKEQCNFNLNGEPLEYSINLKRGWNLVGNPSEGINISDLNGNCQITDLSWTWKNRVSYSFYDSIETLTPFGGEWIYVAEDCRLKTQSAPSFGENKKKMDLYSENEVFLVSDRDWKEVLPLVPVTTFTQQDGDDSECQRGYGTPESVCVYPTLIWHDEVAETYMRHINELTPLLTMSGAQIFENQIYTFFSIISDNSRGVLNTFNLDTFQREERVICTNCKLKYSLFPNFFIYISLNQEEENKIFLESFDNSINLELATLNPGDSMGSAILFNNKVFWFYKKQDTQEYVINQYDLNSRSNHVLKILNGPLSRLQFSPDGAKIFYNEGWSSDSKKLMYFDLLSNEVKEIVGEKPGLFPWIFSGASITSDSLVYQDTRNGNYDVFLYNLNTGIETQLTSRKENQINAIILGKEVFYEEQLTGSSFGEKNYYSYNLEDKSTKLIKDNNIQNLVLIGKYNNTFFFENTQHIYEYTLEGIQVSNSAFDIDSSIYFMQQFDTEKVKIVGETPQELDNLLVAEDDLENHFGAGILQKNIERMEVEDYLIYWESYEDVVYVQDDYELGLLASTYASLLNAPLIIQGTALDEDINFEGRKVICVGNVDRSCDENYDLESLQQKYVDMTEVYDGVKTDKIILTNPNDLDTFVEGELNLEKSSGNIHYLYGKTSLLSPILSSAKHELVLFGSGNFNEIDESLKYHFNLFSFYPRLAVVGSCQLGDSCEIGSTSRLTETYFCDSDIDLYLSKDTLGDTLTYTGGPLRLLNCNDRFALINISNEGNLFQMEQPCNFQAQLSKILFRDFKQGWLNITCDGCNFTFPLGTRFYIRGPRPSWTLTPLSSPSSCHIIELVEFYSNYSKFNFKNIDTTKDYFLEYSIGGYCHNQNLTINNVQIKNPSRGSYQGGTIFFRIPEDLIDSEINVSLSCSEEVSDLEVKIVKVDNFYLTIFSDYFSIPFSKPRNYEFYYLRYDPLDQTEYADFNEDGKPDISVGRISGFSSSDISSYLARDIFYKPTPPKIGFFSTPPYKNIVEKLNSIFLSNGYNSFVDINFYGNKMKWKFLDIGFWKDHGSTSWMGLDDFPPLTNTLILSSACLGLADSSYNSIWAESIRMGSMGFLGAVSVTTSSIYYSDFLIYLYTYAESLGNSVRIGGYSNLDNFQLSPLGYEYSFLGDPTFKPYVPYKLEEELE